MASPTYSFKNTIGAFAHPLVGAFSFAGQIGAGQFVVTMATERTVHDTAADGTVMPSYLAGDSGSVSIEVQQTSDFHAFLMEWYNAAKTQADGGDVSNWANATLTIRSTVDGSTHICSGGSPSKIPDKVYAAQGGRLTWVLMFADIQSLNV